MKTADIIQKLMDYDAFIDGHPNDNPCFSVEVGYIKSAFTHDCAGLSEAETVKRMVHIVRERIELFEYLCIFCENGHGDASDVLALQLHIVPYEMYFKLMFSDKA